MCSVRTVVASLVFLGGAGVPAFCQVIVPPNVPGAAVPADVGTSPFQQTVYSTGPFDFSLAILKNGQLKYCASATVCTSGPFTTIKFDVPLGSFGLAAGDSLLFAFTVRHRGTQCNTTSMTLSLIPVIAPTCSPPPQTTMAPPEATTDSLCWARREETTLG